jgi:hypothetical protein
MSTTTQGGLGELTSGYAPQDDTPLAGYAALMATFAGVTSAFVLWFRRAGRELPDRVAPADLALIAVATHRASRTIAKDRVTSAMRAPFTRFQEEGGPGEVEEQARGRGLRRAVGQLLICPYCLSMWISAAFAAGLLVAPRVTRWIAAVLDVHFASDVLHIVYKRLEDSL